MYAPQVMMQEVNGGALGLLADFLSEPGNTLLIKGFVGTGKTTLALSLLRQLRERRHRFYLSTRVSYQRLNQQYPWIAGILAPEDIKPLPSDAKRPSKYEDVRLADMNLLLQTAFDALTAADNPILVFDSWDALAKEADPVERMRAEKTIIASMDGRKANAVFVSEGSERTNLEFLVDGVISLECMLQNHVRLRKMVLEKLRGKLVDGPVRFFTLNQATFEELPRFHYQIASEPRVFDPLPDTDTFYSTGSHSVDSLFEGGFKKGSVILLEVTADTNRIVLSSLLGLLVPNFVNKGNSALIGLSEAVEEESVERHVQPYLDKVSLNRLKIMKFAKFNDILEKYDAMKFANENNMVVEIDASFMTRREDLQHLLELCGRVREERDLMIIVADGAKEAFDAIQSLVDLHFKIWQDEGYMMLRETRILRTTYALDYSVYKGKPSLRLLPVV